MATKSAVTRAVLADPVRYSIEAKRTWAWTRLERLGRTAQSEMVRLLALREFVERTDPKSRDLTLTGPLTIRWASEAESPSFPTLPARSNGPSTNGSNGNGHAPPSSSATDALASL